MPNQPILTWVLLAFVAALAVLGVVSAMGGSDGR